MKIDFRPAEVFTVQVPFRIVKRGGRKEIVLPKGAPRRGASVDSTIVKALARAFRWKRMLESGGFNTIAELAAQEKIAPTYMTRVMRLALLAPEIVEAIVQERCELALAELLEPFPAEWTKQHQRLDAT